ncbi:MAG: hypothetical protein ACYDFT_04425 [Thermoplasmata archaeon]
MTRSAWPEAPDRWVTVSDLAEQVYCPRARYYRRRDPEAARPEEENRRLRAGRAHHEAELAAVRDLDASWVGPWIAVGAGLLLLAFLLRMGL